MNPHASTTVAFLAIFLSNFKFTAFAQTFCTPDEIFCLYSWKENNNRTGVFRIDVLESGITWTGIGFGSTKMFGSDIYIAKIEPNNSISLTRNTVTYGYGDPEEASIQDQTVFKNETFFNSTSGLWRVTFKKILVTPNSDGVNLNAVTIPMIWAWSSSSIDSSVMLKHDSKGSFKELVLFNETTKWSSKSESSNNSVVGDGVSGTGSSNNLAVPDEKPSESRSASRQRPFNFWMIFIVFSGIVL